MQLKEEYLYEYNENDFKNPFIYENDIKFFKYLYEDSFQIWDYFPIKDK